MQSEHLAGILLSLEHCNYDSLSISEGLWTIALLSLSFSSFLFWFLLIIIKHPQTPLPSLWEAAKRPRVLASNLNLCKLTKHARSCDEPTQREKNSTSRGLNGITVSWAMNTAVQRKGKQSGQLGEFSWEHRGLKGVLLRRLAVRFFIKLAHGIYRKIQQFAWDWADPG